MVYFLVSRQQDFAGVSACWCGFLENPHQQNSESTPAKPKNTSKTITLREPQENNPNEAPYLRMEWFRVHFGVP
jgi:hypothetical protein